jgi:sugar lactone lactonase YvrE
MNNARDVTVALVAAALLAGCDGRSGGLAPALPDAPNASKAPANRDLTKGTARLTVVVPHRAVRLHPDYVSPSSAKLVVSIDKTSTTYGLTVQSPGCKLMQGDVTCTFQIVAAPGRNALGLKLEDAKGRVLSRNVVSVKLTPGEETPVSVTLEAIPARVIAVPGAGSVIEGSEKPAYHVPGLVPEPIEMEALDADGNVIVGPGSPTIATPTITTGASYAKLVSAKTTDPNAYVLEPTAGAAGGHIATISATVQSQPLGNGTHAPPVSSTTNFLFTPALVFGVGRFIQEYSLESGNLVQQFNVCPGLCATTFANDVVSDSNGDIWISTTSIFGISQSHVVEELPPGSLAYSTTLDSTQAVGLAFGPSGTLYVANASGGAIGHRTAPSITEYPQGATSPSVTINDSNITSPVAIAVDPSGNIYLANEDGTIPVYGPGASAPPIRTLSDPSVLFPSSMVADKTGGLYVYDDDDNDYDYYVAYFPAGSTTVSQTLNYSVFQGNDESLTLDPSGDLIASSNGAEQTQVFGASGLPASLNVLQTIYTGGLVAWIP